MVKVAAAPAFTELTVSLVGDAGKDSAAGKTLWPGVPVQTQRAGRLTCGARTGEEEGVTSKD